MIGEVATLRPLDVDHGLGAFRSCVPLLDPWLGQQAHRNEKRGASRTYAVCAGDVVVRYCCLAVGAFVRGRAPNQIQRNMPDTIPVMPIGRLAVDRAYQGHGIGRGILPDATFRVRKVAEFVGIAALLEHAISDDARSSYLSAEFLESSIAQITLRLPLRTT